MLKISILFLFLLTTTFSQNYVFYNSIGIFKKAESFYINPTGFIYVTDSAEDEVFKIDTLGKKIKETGGYGWDEDQFDNPADIFATSLKVYVCDRNNHRIEIFDKDLNYISQIFTRNSDNESERFGYPLSCATSNQGDLFILDSENKRIIKFDLFGNFVLNFGGFDAGKFALTNPLKFSISKDNYIYVVDKNKITVFDQYGNGIFNYNIYPALTNINIVFNYLTVNNKKDIFIFDLSSNSEFSLKKINLDEFEEETKIVSSLIFNKKLYILTPKNILVYKRL